MLKIFKTNDNNCIFGVLVEFVLFICLVVCVVLCLCFVCVRPVSCALYVVKVSGLSILDCLFGSL